MNTTEALRKLVDAVRAHNRARGGDGSIQDTWFAVQAAYLAGREALAAVEQAQIPFSQYWENLGAQGFRLCTPKEKDLIQMGYSAGQKSSQPAPQGQSSLRDEMVRFVTEHAGTKEAAATEFWLRKMPIAMKTGEQP